MSIKCSKCGVLNDPCLCSYPDWMLEKELKRREREREKYDKKMTMAILKVLLKERKNEHRKRTT